MEKERFKFGADVKALINILKTCNVDEKQQVVDIGIPKWFFNAGMPKELFAFLIKNDICTFKNLVDVSKNLSHDASLLISTETFDKRLAIVDVEEDVDKPATMTGENSLGFLIEQNLLSNEDIKYLLMNASEKNLKDLFENDVFRQDERGARNSIRCKWKNDAFIQHILEQHILDNELINHLSDVLKKFPKKYNLDLTYANRAGICLEGKTAYVSDFFDYLSFHNSHTYYHGDYHVCGEEGYLRLEDMNKSDDYKIPKDIPSPTKDAETIEQLIASCRSMNKSKKFKI